MAAPRCTVGPSRPIEAPANSPITVSNTLPIAILKEASINSLQQAVTPLLAGEGQKKRRKRTIEKGKLKKDTKIWTNSKRVKDRIDEELMKRKI